MITPGPDTSCSMALSTSANTTSSGDTLLLPDARASILSTRFITIRWMSVRVKSFVHAQAPSFVPGLAPVRRSPLGALPWQGPSD